MKRAAAGAGRTVVIALEVLAAIVRGLGNAAQIAGVAIATWAAWDVDPLAGKIVLAAGLLFLGGAIRRVVKEVRDGVR